MTHISVGRKDTRDLFFKELHQNIKLKLEFNPSKFLVTEMIRISGSIFVQVFSKSEKFPFKA